jgi:general stress protein 26
VLGEIEMNENEAKRFALQLMETPWAVYLTTIDANGLPQTRAVDNLRSKERFPRMAKWFKTQEDDFWILFTTNTSSAKVDQIKKNPAVSAYYCEARKFQGVMLGGLIEIDPDTDLKKTIWQNCSTKEYDMIRYYPKGINDPDYTILSLHPTHVKGWKGGQGKFSFTLRGKE